MRSAEVALTAYPAIETRQNARGVRSDEIVWGTAYLTCT